MKRSLVEKELLEIRHLIENAYNSWEKRGVLLSADKLDYIAPYENLNAIYYGNNFYPTGNTF